MADSSKATKLLPCKKCLTKFPSEEFSRGVQMCKKCSSKVQQLKCTYCRTDFISSSKNGIVAICSKCEKNISQFGKPKTCMYCNITAAFIGNKCQRCAHSERKYGVPIVCEHCKQKCAYDRKDESKKTDGKLLCWLCTVSYKRALARHNKNESKTQIRVHMSKKARVDVTQQNNSTANMEPRYTLPNLGEKMDDQSNLISMLREKSDSLERQLAVKDAKLMEKDKQITKLQADHFTKEQEMNYANNQRKMTYDREVESLHATVKSLQREVARLKKSKPNVATTNNSPQNSKFYKYGLKLKQGNQALSSH